MPFPDDGCQNGLTPWRRTIQRRVFLQLGAVAGGAVALGACAGTGGADQPLGVDFGGHRHPPPPSLTPEPGVLRFFTEAEARTVDAVVARIIPGDEQDPGAREAGVVTYIDTKLASFETFAEPTFFEAPFVEVVPAGTQVAGDRLQVPEDQLYRYGFQMNETPQQTYRDGLPGLDRYSQGRFGAVFADLGPEDQDAVLELLDSIQQRSEEGSSTPMGGPQGAEDQPGGASGIGANPEGAAAQEAFADVDPGEFFTTVRTDTIEGMFADPLYGGNRGMVGWTMIGFPGPQRSYSPQEMLQGTRRRPQDLDGLPAMNPDRHAPHAPQALEQAQPGVHDG